MVIGGIKLVAFLQDRAVRSAAFEDNSRTVIWTRNARNCDVKQMLAPAEC